MPKSTFIHDKVWPFDFNEYDYCKDIRVWNPEAPLNNPALSDPYNTSISPTPFHGNIKVSIDFDHTITAYPELFARLIHKIRKGGGKIYILTGRSLIDKNFVVDYLKEHNVEYDMIITFPVEYSGQFYDHDSVMDVLIGQFKAQKIKDIGVDIHVDDSTIHIQQIRIKHPDLLILTPWFNAISSLTLEPVTGEQTSWI